MARGTRGLVGWNSVLGCSASSLSPLQFISGQWSHLDVAVYIVLLDYVFGGFVSAVLLSWCWPVYLRPNHTGSHMKTGSVSLYIFVALIFSW